MELDAHRWTLLTPDGPMLTVNQGEVERQRRFFRQAGITAQPLGALIVRCHHSRDQASAG